MQEILAHKGGGTMEQLCPVCNGFTQLDQLCPECKQPYDDLGNIINYFGPYAPYQNLHSFELTQSLVEPEQERCLHVTHCPQCGKHTIVPVEYIYL